ncbi:MAG: hypothetical protein CMJ70_11710 [Planctomycetaceae bacterium]|nr:hypothetical protein [Planctomycetaceae bacterium]HAA70565.1 hypothetical protein [Planctomycetaceae bacterium]
MNVLRETGLITDHRKGIPAREYGSRADYPQKSSVNTTGEIQQIDTSGRIDTTLTPSFGARKVNPACACGINLTL